MVDTSIALNPITWTQGATVALGTQPVGQLLRITHHQVVFWMTW